MFKDRLFAGKKILVTGGGTGLGRGMAEKFLQLGAEVAICGRRKAVCDATAEELMKAHGGKVSSYGVDIRDSAAVDAMIEEIFRGRPADRPRQQRRRQFHLAHRGSLAARLRRDRQYRDARHLLCHAGGGQALDRRPASRRRRFDRGDMGQERRALRRSLGDEQIGDPRHDDVARERMGPLRHSSQCDRAGRNPDRGHEQAPLARRRSRRRDEGQQSAGPRRPHRGIAKSRDVPALGRLRLAVGRNDRDGRRAGARHRRQFLRIAQMERRRLESRARRHPGAERARPARSAADAPRTNKGTSSHVRPQSRASRLPAGRGDRSLRELRRQILRRACAGKPRRQMARGGHRRARDVDASGRGGAAVPRHPRGLWRRGRRLPARSRLHGADRQEGRRRFRRLAAQRDRRALHFALRLGGAEAQMAAAHGERRTRRRHRDDRARRRLRPAGRQDQRASARATNI